MIRRFWQPRYFVVTLIGAALVMLGVRIETLAQNLLAGAPLATIANAVAEDEPAATGEKAAADKTTDKAVEKSSAKAADVKTAETKTADANTATENPVDTHKAPPEDLSEGEMEVLKQLSGRRSLLDEREQELQQKSAILQAAELRVDQKVKDMEKLRAQLQTMLGQLSETQQAQIDNLVKIYEAMKPKEAARILQTLDLPVLLGVMKLMKPAKSAPILAEMDAAKAKDITMTLARQGDIPDTKAAN